MPNLMSCPMPTCGAPIDAVHLVTQGMGAFTYVVRCDCGLSFDTGAQSEAAAVDRWNERPATGGEPKPFDDAVDFKSDEHALEIFSKLMAHKMAKSAAKGRSGWQQCSREVLSQMLRKHVEKGDPVDVANFCMMLCANGFSIASPSLVGVNLPAPKVLRLLDASDVEWNQAIGWNKCLAAARELLGVTP